MAGKAAPAAAKSQCKSFPFVMVFAFPVFSFLAE
jgi:hypothetical protein